MLYQHDITIQLLLVVSNPLKHISQYPWLFPIYGNTKVMFQTTRSSSCWARALVFPSPNRWAHRPSPRLHFTSSPVALKRRSKRTFLGSSAANMTCQTKRDKGRPRRGHTPLDWKMVVNHGKTVGKTHRKMGKSEENHKKPSGKLTKTMENHHVLLENLL